MEEDLDAALDGILSGALRYSEGPGGYIDPMTAELGGRGGQKSVAGRRRETGGVVIGGGGGRGGVEVPSKIDFCDPKFTLATNPYRTKNGFTQKVIDVLSGKGITNFTPIQAEAFVPVLAVRNVVRRSQTGSGKTLAFGIFQ